jgi:hypothetical protein
MCRWTCGAFADGEVAWSWRPNVWRQVLVGLQRSYEGDGGKRNGSPGRAPISRKPLRREGRSVSACACGHRALAQIFFARRPRVQRHPVFPAPSDFGEGKHDVELG